MAYLFNDPNEFADEFVEGFSAAYPSRVRAVTGGVVRRNPAAPGQVAVVIGGGSGHYPAFGGLVGDGLAHGAAMGNLFASPSAKQIHSVATAAAAGGGVLFCFGNYAGDVLNFRQAGERLQSEGVEVRIVPVTDDISSAATDDLGRRRGIAGGLAVYKTAAAAADEGLPLAEVERVALLANSRTRTLGVAFSGCTLPGATEPLFTVPEGRMAVGMGIHGEPGISETAIPSADGLADLFVDSLLADLPADIPHPVGSRVVLLLNGLGSVKYEELFVVFRRIVARLGAVGVEVVDSEVGELVTSFEMAGASLTVFWLDEELERLWNAPVDAPAFRRGTVVVEEGGAPASDLPADLVDSAPADFLVPGTEESREVALVVASAIEAIKGVIDENVDELGRLDSVAGDGDHGIGMQRGSTAAASAARTALAAGAGAGSTLTAAADAWADRAGGTSGVLWGIALSAMGEAVGDERRPSASDVAAGVRAAADGIAGFGRAQLGDKTILDALYPFADALDERISAGDSLSVAWRAASLAAGHSAAATAALVPQIGRARPLAEQSIGHPDPGAISFALVVDALAAALPELSEQGHSEGEGR